LKEMNSPLSHTASIGQAGDTRAARYRRVSSDKQTAANQDAETLALMSGLGLNLMPSYDYCDVGSAWSPRAKLPERDRLLRDVRAGSLRGCSLIIWSMDRFSRAGVKEAFSILDEFLKGGVRIISAKEPWLDTTGPFSEVVLAIVAWAARFESSRKSERVKAAAARVKAEGGRWGRKKLPLDVGLMRELHSQGWGMRRIARHLGLSVGTVHGRLRADKAHS
jgi:DNA invertase Pin-like site-specific DNA recombinase